MGSEVRMSALSINDGSEGPGQTQCLDDQVAELVLLLPSWEALALDEVARTRGMTGGQLARCLIHTFLEHAVPRMSR